MLGLHVEVVFPNPCVFRHCGLEEFQCCIPDALSYTLLFLQNLHLILRPEDSLAETGPDAAH